MNNKNKVAIIGAGAVGLYLSWKLSKKGFKVTVFEKNKKVGLKACSCLISERVKDFIPFDNTLIKNKIKYSLIHFPKKTIRLKFSPVHFALDREKFDESLENIAKEEGVNVIFSKEIYKIPDDFFRIIGCDGALSSTRRHLSLSSPSFRLGVQLLKEGSVVENEETDTWPLKNGFCWRIPKGDYIEYGALGNRDSLKEEFSKFCSDRKISFDWNEVKSALVPQGLIFPKRENITLCGDASGITKPWSGGGIIWGFKAVDILSECFPDLEKYRRKVLKFFRPKLIKGKLASKVIYSIGNNLPFLLPREISRDNDFPFL